MSDSDDDSIDDLLNDSSHKSIASTAAAKEPSPSTTQENDNGGIESWVATSQDHENELVEQLSKSSQDKKNDLKEDRTTPKRKDPKPKRVRRIKLDSPRLEIYLYPDILLHTNPARHIFVLLSHNSFFQKKKNFKITYSQSYDLSTICTFLFFLCGCDICVHIYIFFFSDFVRDACVELEENTFKDGPSNEDNDQWKKVTGSVSLSLSLSHSF
jgi:hypothetical protein